VGAVPAPPGPGVGEIPARALGSEPWPVPVLPAPEFSPGFSAGVSAFKPLPGPVPWPMLEPPPEPPRPGWSPPAGDMASEPLPPVGTPTLEPGWEDSTTPERSVLPPAPLEGASAEPASPGAPRRTPFLPEPEPEESEPPPSEGGGGTTLLASPFAVLGEPRAPVPEVAPLLATDGGGGITFDALREDPWDRPEVEPPEPETDGGGGTMFVPSDVRRVVGEADELELPEVLPYEGGGGMTLAASAVPDPAEELREVPELTAGGGGTTSWVPKSLPMMLLTSDPLAACVGGGGTTFWEAVPSVPLSRRRKS